MSEYLDRVKSPRYGRPGREERDYAALAEICRRSSASDNTFDPIHPQPLDLGIISRLASRGFLCVDGRRELIAVTEAGLAANRRQNERP